MYICIISNIQERGLRGSGAGTLGVPLGGTRRVGGLLAGMNLTEASKGSAPVKSLPAGPLWHFSSDSPPAGPQNVPPHSGACLVQAPTDTSWELHAGS